MRAALLMAAVMACWPAAASDESLMKPAASPPQNASEVKTPASENADLLSRVLQGCPTENRRVFLGNIRFIGDKIADMEYQSIADCLGTIALGALGTRLSRAGKGAAGLGGNRPLPLENLFAGCPASARNGFYDSLQFIDGRLAGMFVGKVKKCGERDMPRFLSLFGAHGMEAAEWKKDCYCNQPGGCVPRAGHVCSPDNCHPETPRRPSAPSPGQ